MRVVFLDDVEGVARVGDIKNVADGYARNFLLPRKLAAAATTSTLQQAEKRSKQVALEDEKRDAGATALAETLAASPFVLTAKAGNEGRLFGSITASDIAEAVNARGASVEHRHVGLRQPIKETGSYTIDVTLTRNVKAQVTVEVKGEGQAEATPAAPVAAVAAEPEAATEAEAETETE